MRENHIVDEAMVPYYGHHGCMVENADSRYDRIDNLIVTQEKQTRCRLCHKKVHQMRKVQHCSTCCLFQALSCQRVIDSYVQNSFYALLVIFRIFV